MSQTTFIYALCEPGTRTVRYIGKTNNPATRLQEHIASSRRTHNHKAYWLRSVLARGLKPVFEILDEVPVAEWPQWEVAWIAFYREQGAELVNANAGGEGGHNPSPETRAKMSVAHIGNKNSVGVIPSEGTRAKISASLMGNKRSLGKKYSDARCEQIGATSREKWQTEEFRAKMRIAQSNVSPETRAKISASNTGKKRTLETRAKISAGNKGKKRAPISDETRNKMKVAHLGSHHSDETRTKIGDANSKRVWTEESRIKIGNSRRGFKHSGESRLKMSAFQKGRPKSEETRVKMSAAAKLREARKKAASDETGNPS